MKIRPVDPQLFHADGRTYRHDEANSFLFCNFLKAPKILSSLLSKITNRPAAERCKKRYCSGQKASTYNISRQFLLKRDLNKPNF